MDSNNRMRHNGSNTGGNTVGNLNLKFCKSIIILIIMLLNSYLLMKHFMLMDGFPNTTCNYIHVIICPIGLCFQYDMQYLSCSQW